MLKSDQFFQFMENDKMFTDILIQSCVTMSVEFDTRLWVQCHVPKSKHHTILVPLPVGVPKRRVIRKDHANKMILQYTASARALFASS